MTKGDPNNMEQKLMNSLQKIKTSDQISDHNRKVLLDFHDFLQDDGLSTGRIESPLTKWR